MPDATVASNVSNETILFFTHELSRTKRKLDEASATHRQMVKRAKGEGVPSDAILESINLSRLDPDERLKKLADRIRVQTIRYPESVEAFTDMFTRMDAGVSEKMRYTDTLFDAETKGYNAGRFGVAADDNPYMVGTEMHQTWRNFWHQGQAAHAMSLGEGAKAASTDRKKPAGKKAAEPELPGVPAASRKAARKTVRKAGRKANGASPEVEEAPATTQ